MSETTRRKTMSTKTKVTVTQPDPPIERSVLAEAIVDISKAATALTASGLNRKAVVVLLADKSKVSKRVIVDVLDALGDLQRDYCR